MQVLATLRMQLVAMNWLSGKFVRSSVQCFKASVFHCVGSECDNGNRHAAPSNMCNGLTSVHNGHTEIHKDKTHARRSWISGKVARREHKVDCFLTVASKGVLNVEGTHHLAQHLPIDAIVVDY